MAMNSVVEHVEESEFALSPTSEERRAAPWNVILFNDDIHSFDEVIMQLIKATGCSSVEAARTALKAHFTGKALAFAGSFPECYRVNGALRAIQLTTEISG